MIAPIHRALPLAVIAAMAIAASADTLPVSYLTPQQFTAALDTDVRVHVESGAALAATTTTWPSDKLSWFFVRSRRTQENHDTVDPVDGRTGQATGVRLTQPGVTVVGFDTKPQIVHVSGTELKSYLTKNIVIDEESAAVRELAKKTDVRVRYRESAATIIRVAAADGKRLHSGIAMSKRGQMVEVQAMFDPTMLTVGSDFPVRVHINGSKQPNVRVQATSMTGAKTEAKTTDPAGSTYFHITHAGVWRIEFHQAMPLEGDKEADWVVYSGTLTFEVPEEEGAAK